MKLWLVRHGETEANVAGLYSGHAPTPLTPRGVAQARTLGERLRLAPFDKVFCSELARTGTTADLLLGDRAIPRERHPALNEMFFGDWEMRHHRDLQREDAENYAARCADWQHAAPTNGESFQNFARRVSEFIPTLTDCRHLDHLLIVGHQGVLSLLTALLLQMPPAAMWHFPIAHGAWSLLEIRDDFTTLRVLNSQPSGSRKKNSRQTIDRPEQAVILRCQAASAKAGLQKLFYKNGDAIRGEGWDDSPPRTPADRHFTRLFHQFRYTVRLFMIINLHAPRGNTCRVKHSRILLSTKLMT